MPNTLKSNAIVWHHFSKDPQEKRGKCLHCGQLISYEKSTLSNLRRHLYRKHEEVLRHERDTDTKQFESVPVHYVWEHFIKQPEEKAKCVYCYSVLGCPKNVVGNLIRHLKSRHPSLVLEQQRGQEALFEEVSRTQYHAESIEDSLGTSTSLQELELELDADLFSAEVHQIDGTNLPSSVKIELVHPDTESCPDDADQEVIEEEIINESQQEINCEDMDASSQYEEHVHHPDEMLSPQTMEESIVRTSTLPGENKELELNESPRRQDNFFSIGMKDISMKTAIYATNVAMELEGLPLRQRIFAQKLIADVMFHAKLDNLTEYAMILGKVNRPFDV
ncbi:uncharacterized protein LOC121597793 isoform X1 [Anopheles merus]|nr:uncharacterized protein LOC121597793 isoform X1 [Anopheles merus]XP_041779864.1 uncharacterized protein LOC121597793 isoform X1 [Anopheles merus]XP_041779865.1 uncharacterized protein LOC121597793 isoform X1 [Anopheles merus]